MKITSKAEPLSLPEVENLLEKTDGKPRADLLNKLAALVVKNDKDRGNKISSEALDLSENLGYRRGKAAAQFGLGESARIGGEYRAALEYYASSLDIFEVLGDPIQQGRCLRRLGDVQYFVNNLNLSLKHYLNSLMIFEKTAEKNGSPEAKINCGHLMATIGNVLRDSGDLEASLDYYQRCHSIYIREGFTEGIPGVLYNTGNIFHSQDRLEQALNVYEQALERAEESGDGYLASLALNSLGSVHMDMGELDAAEDYFNRSMDIAEKQDITARWGGEEFLLLLPETSLHSAVKVAKKAKALIEDTPFVCNSASINLTMTFGVSEGGIIPVEDAIQLADTALYRGKRTGKNSVNFQSCNR